jgi:hypothetical protein
LSKQDNVIEDGHKDFFDTKKKPNPAKAKNRFAAIDDKDSNDEEK